MNLPKSRVIISFIFFCFAGSAIGSPIEFNGYKYTDNSQSVKGESLDWMRWDLTRGLSAEEALDIYGIKGWRLASNAEVSKLFLDFGLGVFDEDAASSQLKIQTISSISPIYSRSNLFFSMFSSTYQTDATPSPADVDVDGNVLHASYKEGVTFSTALLEGNTYAEVGVEWGVMNYGHNNVVLAPETSRVFLGHFDYVFENLRGVALVRSNLLEPGSMHLLCLGLVSFCLIRRLKKTPFQEMLSL